MKTKNQILPLAAAMGSLALAATSANAAYVAIEDFESHTLGTAPSSANGWVGADMTNTLTPGSIVVDPADAGNQVAALSTRNAGYDIPLGGNSIADSTTGTVFFRVRTVSGGGFIAYVTREDVPTTGWWDRDDAGAFNDGSVSRPIYNAGATAAQSDGTWYNFWAVANNTLDTFDLYRSTGTDGQGDASFITIDTGVAFGGSAAGALDHFFFAGDGGTPTAMIDDIYVDTSGANLANPLAGPDNDPPEISTLSPADDATGVAPSADLVATFDEAIALTGVGTITVTDTTDATGSFTIDLTSLPDMDAAVSVSGAELTIDPTTALEGGSGYAVQISADAIVDLAASPNGFAGILNNNDWNFATVAPDTTAPEISSLVPADDATGVEPATTLLATFDEDIALTGVGTITVTDTTDATGSFTIDLTSLPDMDAAVSVSGAELTIDPTTALEGVSGYAVQISADAIEDLSGNDFAGILNDDDWSFTTAQAATALIGGSLNNGDFESPNVAGATTFIGGTITSWSNWSEVDTADDNTGIYDNGTAGSQAAYLQGGGAIRNMTTHTIAVGDTFDFGYTEVLGSKAPAIMDLVYDNGGVITAFGVNQLTDDATTNNFVHTGTSYTVLAGDAWIGSFVGVGLSENSGGFPDIDNITLDVTPTPVPGGNDFSDWIAGYSVGGQTGIGDDPDLDGVDSGVENFFGTAPDTFTQGLVSDTADTGAGTFTFTHPQTGTIADDLTATYQWSVDLENFFADGVADGGVQVDFVATPNTPSAGITTVVATVTTGPVPEKLFVDVEVTQN